MHTLAAIHHDDIVPIVAISVGGSIAVLWLILASIHSFFKMLQVEKSRREIAAYIAEGSMTPDQGERLLKAYPKEDSDD
ncbi:MAG: hypothetical protein AAGF47_12355 [Planctomycetota bacterium]